MLRPYQTKAVDAVLAKLKEHRSTLLVLPTGTGKTVVFTKVAEAMRARGRVLVLAHRDELINQAVDKLTEWTSLTTAIEKGDQRASDIEGAQADVVVASVQTLSRQSRLDRFHPDEFALIIADEAHHAPAKTWRRVFDYFASAKLLGVTATADRGDGKGLGQVFESVAFEYGIREAISDGWLCDIRQKFVHVPTLDLSAVRTTAGDLNAGQLDQVMRQEGAVDSIAWPTIQEAGARPTMVFCVTVAHSKAVAQAINTHAGHAAAVALDGTASPEYRQQTVQAFQAGEFQYLSSCSLFLEGFDCPPVACISMARPTESRALYTQAIGRGTRIHPGKEDLLVLDFCGNAGRHSLASTLDVLAGETIDTQTKDKAIELVDELPAGEALDKARELVAAEAEQLRIRTLSQVSYTTYTKDPFELINVELKPVRWGHGEASEAQLTTLKKFGVELSQPPTKGQASVVLDKLIKRSKRGMASYKQVKCLAARGIDGSKMTRDEATEVISAIANNNWKLPPELRPAG